MSNYKLTGAGHWVFTRNDRILSKNKFLYFLNNLLTLPVKQVLHSMLSPKLSESSR